jgi:hypothetical protein
MAAGGRIVNQPNKDALRQFVPAFEDQMAMVGRPFYTGGFRWFRSPNVLDLLEARHRRRGLASAARYPEEAPAGRRSETRGNIDLYLDGMV